MWESLFWWGDKVNISIAERCGRRHKSQNHAFSTRLLTREWAKMGLTVIRWRLRRRGRLLGLGARGRRGSRRCLGSKSRGDIDDPDDINHLGDLGDVYDLDDPDYLDDLDVLSDGGDLDDPVDLNALGDVYDLGDLDDSDDQRWDLSLPAVVKTFCQLFQCLHFHSFLCFSH